VGGKWEKTLPTVIQLRGPKGGVKICPRKKSTKVGWLPGEKKTRVGWDTPWGQRGFSVEPPCNPGCSGEDVVWGKDQKEKKKQSQKSSTSWREEGKRGNKKNTPSKLPGRDPASRIIEHERTRGKKQPDSKKYTVWDVPRATRLKLNEAL